MENELEQMRIRLAEMAAEIERQQSLPVAVPDHVISKTINDLRDIAIEYRGTQQLREQIALVITPLIKSSPRITEQDAREIATDFDSWNCGQNYLGSYSEWYEKEGRELINKLNSKQQ